MFPRLVGTVAACTVTTFLHSYHFFGFIVPQKRTSPPNVRSTVAYQTEPLYLSCKTDSRKTEAAHVECGWLGCTTLLYSLYGTEIQSVARKESMFPMCIVSCLVCVPSNTRPSSRGVVRSSNTVVNRPGSPRATIELWLFGTRYLIV